MLKESRRETSRRSARAFPGVFPPSCIPGQERHSLRRSSAPMAVPPTRWSRTPLGFFFSSSSILPARPAIAYPTRIRAFFRSKIAKQRRVRSSREGTWTALPDMTFFFFSLRLTRPPAHTALAEFCVLLVRPSPGRWSSLFSLSQRNQD